MDKLRDNEEVMLSMHNCLLTKEKVTWRVYQGEYLMISTGIGTYALEHFLQSARAEKLREDHDNLRRAVPAWKQGGKS